MAKNANDKFVMKNQIIIANENGENVYSIPMEWVVSENLKVRAKNLPEAVTYLNAHSDEIPLGTEPAYIDGTYKISADENNNLNTDEIVSNLEAYGYEQWPAEKFFGKEA